MHCKSHFRHLRTYSQKNGWAGVKRTKNLNLTTREGSKNRLLSSVWSYFLMMAAFQKWTLYSICQNQDLAYRLTDGALYWNRLIMNAVSWACASLLVVSPNICCEKDPRGRVFCFVCSKQYVVDGFFSDGVACNFSKLTNKLWGSQKFVRARVCVCVCVCARMCVCVCVCVPAMPAIWKGHF